MLGVPFHNKGFVSLANVGYSEHNLDQQNDGPAPCC